MYTNSSGPIKIDVKAVIRQRLGKLSKFLPTFLLNKLERVICQERLNELLLNNYPKEGAEFCKGVFNDLNVNIEVVNSDRLPSRDKSRVILVSNHPLGGLDGMALIAYFSEYFGKKVLFVVNDLLTAVKPLTPVFLPINTHGRQSRDAFVAIDEAMQSEYPIIIFPAGLVSRQLQQNGPIKDLAWKKMFINKAVSFKRDIVPLYFDGINSTKFYSYARRRQKLGLKFNYEMILLPSEVIKSEGKTFKINCGATIPYQTLKGGACADKEAEHIKETVYELKKELSLI